MKCPECKNDMENIGETIGKRPIGLCEKCYTVASFEDDKVIHSKKAQIIDMGGKSVVCIAGVTPPY